MIKSKKVHLKRVMKSSFQHLCLIVYTQLSKQSKPQTRREVLEKPYVKNRK